MVTCANTDCRFFLSFFFCLGSLFLVSVLHCWCKKGQSGSCTQFKDRLYSSIFNTYMTDCLPPFLLPFDVSKFIQRTSLQQVSLNTVVSSSVSKKCNQRHFMHNPLHIIMLTSVVCFALTPNAHMQSQLQTKRHIWMHHIGEFSQSSQPYSPRHRDPFPLYPALQAQL